MATTAKRKQIIAKHEKATKGSETTLSSDNYQVDLLRALNYYNINHDDKDKKKWYLSHVAKTDKALAKELNKVDDYYFRYLGILARMMDTGTELRDAELKSFENRVKVIHEKLKEKQQEKAIVKQSIAPAMTVQDRIEELFHEHASEIDGEIDSFIQNGSSEFSAKTYFTTNNVSAPVVKKIKQFYEPRLKEIALAYLQKEPQLTEGYSHIPKRKFKKLLEFVKSIIDDCEIREANAKVARKPRVRKAQPPAKVVAKVQYMKEFSALGLKSINPTSLLDSKEVWLYNTKYKKIIRLVSDMANTLTVKGTTIVGFDVQNSVQYTIRKPEEFFKGLALTKRPLNSKIKTLTTKPTKPNGRINSETIILGAF